MSADTSRFCGSCGAPRESMAIRFCRQCGAAFAPTGAVGAAPVISLGAAPLRGARRRPRALVTLLGLLGSGTYAFFWLWMSWRELKRVSGDASMRPFWHAFAMFVIPLYGLFRFHAHFRTIDELLEAARVPVRAGAGLLTLVFFLLLSVLYASLVLAFVAFVALPAGAAAVLAPRSTPLSIVVVASGYGYIVSIGQAALNAYYRSLSGVEIPERGHALEYLFVLLFALAFAAQMYASVPGRGL